MRVERQERHQHHVGLEDRPRGQRLGDTPRGRSHLVARRPGAKEQRQPLALHHRQGEPQAFACETLQERARIDFVADGGEARHDGAGRNRQKAEPILGQPQGGVLTVQRVGTRTAGERPDSLCPFFVRHRPKE